MGCPLLFLKLGIKQTLGLVCPAWLLAWFATYAFYFTTRALA
jgi:hypothetical protein